MYVDSHCHILSGEYENPEEVIRLVKSSCVGFIIINGYDLNSSREAVLLAEKYDNVYAAIGVGPENIDAFNDEVYNEFESLISSKRVIAIGEIGLDYYWRVDNKKQQKEVFKRLLFLAKSNSLPVIVHSRSAIEETYSLLKQYDVKGIMHCFSGSYEMAIKFVNIGFLIGVGGIVTFKNARRIKEVVSQIDLENISLETDSPYLTPEPYRGTQNSPVYIPLIASSIAALKSIDIAEVARVTTNNIYRIFDRIK